MIKSKNKNMRNTKRMESQAVDPAKARYEHEQNIAELESASQIFVVGFHG
jgi:hypothetical protein